MSRQSKKIKNCYIPSIPQARRELQNLDNTYYPSIINLHIEEKENEIPEIEEAEEPETNGQTPEQKRETNFIKINAKHIMRRGPKSNPDAGRKIMLREPSYTLEPDEEWTDEELEAWAMTWPFYSDASQMSWKEATRYHKATSNRFGYKDYWHGLALGITPIVIAITMVIITYAFFIAGKGYLALHWGYLPVIGGVGGGASFLVTRDLIKNAKFARIFGRATISFRDRNHPGQHKSKIMTHYPKLAKLTKASIHRGPIGAGGISAGAITIPIYIGETIIDGRLIKDEHDVTWQEAMLLEPEHKDDNFLNRGFTLRVTQTIYGKMYSVTKHGDIESGTKAHAERIMAELAGWLPAFLVWLAVLLSIMSGFSLNQAVSQYLQSLPENVQNLVTGG